MDYATKSKKFSDIFIEHSGDLKCFAVSLCKNEFDADDLVSETIRIAIENFRSLKDERKIKPWLFKILNNQFISNCRSRKKFVEIVGIPDEGGHYSTKSTFFEASPYKDFVEKGNPEKKFSSQLTQKQIKNAINELPDEFRSTLMLCDMEGFSYAEISKILTVPIGTVRSRIARSRQILQRKLRMQAKELGIKATKTSKKKMDYACNKEV